MNITVKRLSSGWWHIRGEGPENWAQPPEWPCSENSLREYAASGASDRFIQAAMNQIDDHDPPDSRNHMAKPYDEALIDHLRNNPPRNV